MKKSFLSFFILAISLSGLPLFSQTGSQTENDSTLLGLPGDNLDLYAVLDLFQKSKTIEDFEKSLNLEKTGINNLDLDLDNKVDFIKVVTKQDGDDFTFVLQVAVTEKETQDVAVIFVSKDKDKKVTMQIVGDKDLYGKDYIVEPKTTTTPAVTANPGYVGQEPVTVSTPATTTVVVVESAPIVQYVYSPVYVPYYPPYYYGFYPPYFAAFSVMAVSIYAVNHSYYHHGGYGYHGNTTVIHNTNNYNNYNNSRNSSNTVNHNKANGNYNSRNNASTRPSTGASTRPSTGASTRPSTGASTRQSASPSTRQSTGSSASNRQSASPSTRQSTGSSASSRQSSNYSSQQSRSSSAGASRSRSSGSYGGGGGYSSGSSRSGGGYSGGGSRGGGGGGRRR
jgi:hypothetical protein